MKKNLLLFVFFLAFFIDKNEAQSPVSTDLQQIPIAQLDSLQQLCLRQGNYRQGYAYTQVWLSKAEQQYGKKDTHYYHASHALANYLRELGKHLELHQHCEQMERDIRRDYGTENKFYADAIGDLASASFSTGKGDVILKLYRQLVELRGKIYGKKHPEYARALYNLGTSLSFVGQFSEAEALFKESLTILEKATGNDYGHIISPLNGLAQILANQKRYAEAEALFLKALAIGETAFSKNNRRYNMVVKNLADLYRSSKRYTEAEALYKKVMASIEKNNGKTHIYLVSGRELADLYITTQQYDKAKKMLDELMTAEENTMKEHPVRTITYSYLTHWATATDQWDKALEYALRGLALNLEKPLAKLDVPSLVAAPPIFRNAPFALTNIEQLVEILQHFYQKDKQAKWLQYRLQVCKWGIDITERIKNSIAYEGDKFSFLDIQSRFAASGVDCALALQQPEAAFLFAEQNKAASLAGALKAQKASFFGDLPDSLRQKENYLGQAIDRKNKELWETTDAIDKASLQAELNALYQQNTELRQHIKEHYPKYHQLKYKPFSTTLPEIQEILKKDMLLIEYVLSENTCYVFCLTKDELKSFSFPIAKGELEEQVKQLRYSLSNYENLKNDPEKSYKSYTASAFWFYKTFLAQALAMVPDKQHLLIIPDGLLGHLPFEAFLTEAVQGEKPYSDLPYLLQKYQVSYSYSATLLAENCKFKCTLNPKILAYAASYSDTLAAIKTRSPQQQNLRQVLGDLPNAQAEVRRLESLFTGAFLYGNYANERSFKELAPNYSILHLAMHGLLDKQNPLLSSLAFTENGDTLEDNFLQAHEISHIQLNAMMVVLSACETGYGKFQAGEGIMSLGRAFMYAGVPSLVVSLWEVNDASTSKIMEYFYLNIAQDKNKAEALRQAKLQYLKEAKGYSAHPAFWSAFVQIGDSVPLQLRQESTFWWLYVLSGMVLVMGVLVFRKKWRRANS